MQGKEVFLVFKDIHFENKQKCICLLHISVDGTTLNRIAEMNFKAGNALKTAFYLIKFLAVLHTWLKNGTGTRSNNSQYIFQSDRRNVTKQGRIRDILIKENDLFFSMNNTD